MYSRMLTLLICLACAAAALCVSPAPRRADAGASDTLPASVKLNLDIIERSDDPDTIVLAYRAARDARGDDARVYDAFMRRMHAMGLIHVAEYPARTLRALDPTNALAPAIVGYMELTRDHKDKALEAFVSAGGLGTDDDSIIHDLGQLVAWYELAPKKTVFTPTVRRDTAVVKARLTDKTKTPKAQYDTFASAYAYGKAVSEGLAAVHSKYKAPLAAARSDVSQATRTAGQARRDAAGEIALHKASVKKLDALEAKVAQVQAELDGLIPLGQLPRALRTRQRQAQRRLRSTVAQLQRGVPLAQAQTQQAKDQADEAREQADQADDAVARARKIEKDLRKRMRGELLALEKKWTWVAPKSQGKAVAMVAFVPGAKLIPAPGAEEKARAILASARLYVRNKVPALARARLRKIISSYSATEAAGDARRMLDTLGEPDGS